MTETLPCPYCGKVSRVGMAHFCEYRLAVTVGDFQGAVECGSWVYLTRDAADRLHGFIVERPPEGERPR